MSDLDFVVRLAVGLLCGVAIGLERQWRGRTAGLRTTALVGTGACLFVLFSVAHSDTASYDRIAAQVVSGVGFLGAGVILREGIGISGLNTAATLWCAAAVGTLAAGGHFFYAIAGSGAVIVANLLLRSVARRIDLIASPVRASEITYEFRAVSRAAEEAHIRALLTQSLSGSAFTLRGLHSQDINGADRVEVRAILVGHGTDQTQLESAVSRLSLEPSVSAVTWQIMVPDVSTADEDETETEDVRPNSPRWQPWARGGRH